jgi:hypothetical protein
MGTNPEGDPNREAKQSDSEVKGSLAAQQKADLKKLLLFTGFVLVIENILLGIWVWAVEGKLGWPDIQSYKMYGLAMLCSAAASFVGGLIGFLFGIPRTDLVIRAHRTNTKGLERSADAAETGITADAGNQVSRMRVNTNLEDVSDGLTKALLGIGLSQISNVGEWAGKIANVLGPSLGGGSAGKIVGLSVLIYGGFAGFFFGYLATRIYLTGAFLRADPSRTDSAPLETR